MASILHRFSVTTLQMRLTIGILILTHHPCIESDLTEVSSFSTATKLCVSLFKKRASKCTLLIIEYSPGAESTTMQREEFPSPSPLLCEWKMSLTLVCHKYRTMEVIPENAECHYVVSYIRTCLSVVRLFRDAKNNCKPFHTIEEMLTRRASCDI